MKLLVSYGSSVIKDYFIKITCASIFFKQETSIYFSPLYYEQFLERESRQLLLERDMCLLLIPATK